MNKNILRINFWYSSKKQDKTNSSGILNCLSCLVFDVNIKLILQKFLFGASLFFI